MAKQRSVVNPGEKYNMLTVISEAEDEVQYSHGDPTYIRRVLCRCDCGASVVTRLTGLRTGYAKSCGCLTRKASKQNLSQVTHGMSRTKFYTVWNSLKERCYNKKTRSYKTYGARGIRVCDEWRHDFMAFYKWASATYKEGLSIERINNDGNYEPSNCTWATAKEQASNRSTSKKNK